MLTPSQKPILDYIYDQRRETGIIPSQQEIAEFLQLSVSTVNQHIAALEKNGYLERARGKARAIELIERGADLSLPFPTNKAKVVSEKTATFRTLPHNKIILGDAVPYLKKLPDDTYDAIIIDPPYNIGKNFGNNIDKRELEEYVTWAKEWIDESLRVLKPSGTMFIYGFSEILAHLSVLLPLYRQRWLVWHYTNKNVASLNFWQRSHESILCVWKDERIFNRDSVREPYTEGFLQGAAGRVRKDTIGRFSRGGKKTVYAAHEKGALPRDVLKTPALAGGAGMTERWFLCKTCRNVYEPRALEKHRSHNILKHPTQKPFELTRRLLQSCLPSKNARVLIPFAGSGSECVIARELGAEYLGIEINPEYVELARGLLNKKGR